MHVEGEVIDEYLGKTSMGRLIADGDEYSGVVYMAVRYHRLAPRLAGYKLSGETELLGQHADVDSQISFALDSFSHNT